MSSRRIVNVEHAVRDHWRALAARAQYDVPAAARLLGISLRSLERLCQHELDCTPKECFHRERMAAGAQLLAARQSVKTVATRLGYTFPANFSRDFKRHFGRSPRAFAPRLLPTVSFPDAIALSAQDTAG